MRVLHLLASNKYSGAENVVCQIINIFRNDIEMAYCSPNGEIKNTLFNLDIKYIPLEKLNYENVEKAIKVFKPDIIHAHDLRACVVASKFKNIKKIAQIHCNHKGMNKFSLRSIMAKVILNKFNKIIWVSNSSFNDFIFNKSIQVKSVILKNVVNIENIEIRKQNALIDEGFDVVYCGRLTELKNPTRIVDIAKKLSIEKKDIKVGIIGSGDLSQAVKSKIEEYGLSENVEMLGFVENPFKIIENSKVMLITSKTEGIPMTALESFCLSTPIITTKVGGMVEIIKEGTNGYFYQTDEQAKEIILNIINNDELLRELKIKTKEYAVDYNSIKNYKAQLDKVYVNG